MRNRLGVVIAAFVVSLGAAGNARATTINFTTGPFNVTDYVGSLDALIAPSITRGDVTVTGSADVVLLQSNGLFLATDAATLVVGGTEYLDFAFDSPVVNLSYRVNATADTNGNFVLGERTIEAFGLGGVSLGVFGESGNGSFDVSALVAGAPITGFRLQAPGYDGFRPSSVSFETVPEPASVILFGSGALALLRRRARRT